MSDLASTSHFSNLSITDNMSIVDVCYQSINDTYSYGSYLGFRVIINVKTGYVNATKLCGAHGKLFKNWTPLSNTHQLITAFNGNQHLTQDGWLTKSIQTTSCVAQNSSAGIQADENNWSVLLNSVESSSIKPAVISASLEPIKTWSTYVDGGKGNLLVSGTYIYPRLLPVLAMWISPGFYFLAADLIENFAIRCYKRMTLEATTELNGCQKKLTS